jgi:hypothetical protein
MPTSENGLWYPEDRRKPDDQPGGESQPAAGPQLEVDTGEGVFHLTPSDSVLRTFGAQHQEFDHIIHQEPASGRIVAIFIADEDPLIREFFEGHQYPTREDEAPDEETYDYFAKALVKDMPDTLDPAD